MSRAPKLKTISPGDVAPLAAAVGLFFIGFVLNPIPRDPDVVFHPLDRVGTALIFISWTISVVCWGRALSTVLRRRSDGVMGWFAFGTLGAVLSIGVLGILGCVGPSLRWLYVALMLLGPLVDVALVAVGVGVAVPLKHHKAQAAAREALSFVSGADGVGRGIGVVGVVFLVGIAFELGSRLFGAGIAHFHSDPMFYHMVGPRQWFDAGQIRFNPLAPVTGQCGYWEVLGLWANELVAGPHGAGLLDSLLFMQWVSVVFGYAASAVAVERILSQLGTPVAWRRLAVFAALTSGVMGWAAWLAKNDWALAFWVLTGFSMLLDARRRQTSSWVLGGLFIGAAISNKFVLLIPITALGAAFAWRGLDRSRQRFATAERWGARELGLTVAGILIAMLPIMAHDWAVLGNPLFPTLNSFFRSPWVTDSVQDKITAALLPTRYGFSWSSVARVQLLLLRDPFVLLGALMPLVTVAFVRTRADALEWMPLAALTLTFAFVGVPRIRDDGTLHLRYLGFVVALAPALALCSLQRALERFKVSSKVEVAILAVLFVAAASRFQHPIVTELYDPPTALDVSLAGGDGKRWLRLHARPGDLIFTTGDNHIYPVSHLNVVVMTDVPYLDWIDREVTDPVKFVSLLKGLGVKYLLDSRTPLDGYWGEAAITLEVATGPHPEALVFASSRSVVADIDILYDRLVAACSAGSLFTR